MISMPHNVLITAASRRVALTRAFKQALMRRGGGRVIVTDVNPLSPAVQASDRAYQVPLASDPGYADEVLAICQAERVGLVIPTIDDELTLFGYAAAAFERAGVFVVVSPSDTTMLCSDKYQTCRTLAERGVSAAPSYLPSELPDDPAFPLFIKPRHGRGGIGATAARNRRELEFFLTYVDDPIVQQYLDGPEFTIDVLCDFAGRALSIVPRERVVIRAGVIDRGRTVNDPRLIALAQACVEALPFAGPINIQCRIVGGIPIVFEINPRFSGGIALTIESGADFPSMLLTLAAGEAVPPSIGRFDAGLWMTSYEASMFVHEDRIKLHTLRPARAVGEVA
jgi:carbamoyl-phosphate synthase large subunit